MWIGNKGWSFERIDSLFFSLLTRLFFPLDLYISISICIPVVFLSLCSLSLFFRLDLYISISTCISIDICMYSQSHLGWHFRIMFQSSKLKARTCLFTETWQKWRSSFELWAFENVTPSGIDCISATSAFVSVYICACDRIVVTKCTNVYRHKCTSCRMYIGN